MKNQHSVQQLTRKKNRVSTLINSALKENAAALKDPSRKDPSRSDFDSDLDLEFKGAQRNRDYGNKSRDSGNKKRDPNNNKNREDIEREIERRVNPKLTAKVRDVRERLKAADEKWLKERNQLNQETIQDDDNPFIRITKDGFDPFDY